MHDDMENDYWDFTKKQDRVTIEHNGFCFWYLYMLRHNLLFSAIHCSLLSIITTIIAIKLLK